MKLEVQREACCSQDDQMGPLAQSFELPGACSLGDFVLAVASSRFLQFSSSHTALACSMAGRHVATVFSPYLEPRRETVFVLPRDSLLQDLAPDGACRFDFVFD